MKNKKKKTIWSENEINRRTRVGVFSWLPFVTSCLATIGLLVILLRGITTADIPFYSFVVGIFEAQLLLLIGHEMLMTVCNEASGAKKAGAIACFTVAFAGAVFSLIMLAKGLSVDALSAEDPVKALALRFLIGLGVQLVALVVIFLLSRPWHREKEERIARKKELEQYDAED